MDVKALDQQVEEIMGSLFKDPFTKTKKMLMYLLNEAQVRSKVDRMICDGLKEQSSQQKMIDFLLENSELTEETILNKYFETLAEYLPLRRRNFVPIYFGSQAIKNKHRQDYFNDDFKDFSSIINMLSQFYLINSSLLLDANYYAESEVIGQLNNEVIFKLRNGKYADVCPGNFIHITAYPKRFKYYGRVHTNVEERLLLDARADLKNREKVEVVDFSIKYPLIPSLEETEFFDMEEIRDRYGDIFWHIWLMSDENIDYYLLRQHARWTGSKPSLEEWGKMVPFLDENLFE